MTFFDINKIMKGSPPPIEYQVTLDNWRKYPFNSWSFVNVRNLIPTSPIYNNPDKKVILQKQLIDIDDLVICLLYTSPSPRDRGCARMPSSA